MSVAQITPTITSTWRSRAGDTPATPPSGT